MEKMPTPPWCWPKSSWEQRSDERRRQNRPPGSSRGALKSPRRHCDDCRAKSLRALPVHERPHRVHGRVFLQEPGLPPRAGAPPLLGAAQDQLCPPVKAEELVNKEPGTGNEKCALFPFTI